MKKATLIAAVLMTLSICANANEFWDVYAERLARNYSTKVGAIPMEGASDILESREVAAIMSKSFSQSFGIRFSENAKDRRALLIVCAFSNEAEKCYIDPVIRATFGETRIFKAPEISQRFIKKIGIKYSATLARPDSMTGTRERAKETPNWKAFNPRIGVNMGDIDVILASPFHTFAGVFAEPRWGTKSGPAIKLLKGRAALDFRSEGVVFNYDIKGEFKGAKKIKLTIRPEGEIRIDNVVVFW